MPRKRRPGRPRLPGSRKLVSFSVGVPRSTWAFLEAHSGERETSIAGIARIAIQEYRERVEAKQAQQVTP
jgi:hypothetical protein